MQAEATKRALIDAGRRLFVERGYSAVTAEDVVRAVGPSKGYALDEYSGGLQGLFEAIFNELEDKAMLEVAAALRGESDPWRQVVAGMDAYLGAACAQDYREIVILQGPTVLGRQRWRELDRGHFEGLLTEVVRALQGAGVIAAQHPAELVASAGRGTLTELAVAVGEADDPAEAQAQASLIARKMLTGLATPGD